MEKRQKMLYLEIDVIKSLDQLPNASAYVNDLLKKNLGYDEMTEAQLEAELEAIKVQKEAEAKIQEIRANAR